MVMKLLHILIFSLALAVATAAALALLVIAPLAMYLVLSDGIV
jgi:hypothetical protein